MNKNVTLLFTFLAIFSFSGLVAQSTFINEINYISTNPLGKGFEIAGPAGQNLQGWVVALYDSDGSMTSTRSLGSRVIPNQENGHGSVWFEMEQLSGTSGFALINPVNSVVQFVGFGLESLGGLTAIDGPAQGKTADFAGIQLLPDNSLELTGIGLNYLDFIWSLPLGKTPADINTGQIFGLLRGLLWFLHEAPAPSANPLDQTIDNQIKVNIFPNPATNYVRLNRTNAGYSNETVNVYLMDASGRVLQRAQLGYGDTSLEFDLSRLARGNYLIRYEDGGKTVVHKLVKQ